MPPKKAPKSKTRVKRKPSAYNNFLGKFLKGKGSTTSFKAGVAAWKKLSKAEQAKYA
jgi:hypothetical protein